MNSEKKPAHILFLCVANSARSQLAEGLARQILPGAWVESAGSKPSQLNPFAVAVLKEIEIDISEHHSKSVDMLSPAFLDSLDCVITLCAEEVCPLVLSKARQLHWGFSDPAGPGAETEQMERFRAVRDGLIVKLTELAKTV